MNYLFSFVDSNQEDDGPRLQLIHTVAGKRRRCREARFPRCRASTTTEKRREGILGKGPREYPGFYGYQASKLGSDRICCFAHTAMFLGCAWIRTANMIQ